MDVQLLLVPYDSGHRGLRMGAGPEHLRASGLLSTIASRVPIRALTISAYDPSCDRTGTVQEAAFAATAALLSAIEGQFPITKPPYEAVSPGDGANRWPL